MGKPDAKSHRRVERGCGHLCIAISIYSKSSRIADAQTDPNTDEPCMSNHQDLWSRKPFCQNIHPIPPRVYQRRHMQQNRVLTPTTNNQTPPNSHQTIAPPKHHPQPFFPHANPLNQTGKPESKATLLARLHQSLPQHADPPPPRKLIQLPLSAPAHQLQRTPPDAAPLEGV